MITNPHHETITNANHAIARWVAMRPLRRGGNNICRLAASGEKCVAQCVSSLATGCRPAKLRRLTEPPRDRRRESIRRAVGYGEKHVGFDELELHQPERPFISDPIDPRVERHFVERIERSPSLRDD